ncbi:helix-turn-helix domain-containing protein, partial [Nonomuraea sp. NPDC055795]
PTRRHRPPTARSPRTSRAARPPAEQRGLGRGLDAFGPGEDAAGRDADRDAKRHLAEELLDHLDRDLSGADVAAGIGEPVTELPAFFQSYGQARRAARVTRLVEGFGRVAGFDRLGVYGLLVRIPLDELTPQALPPGLRRLLDAGAKGEQLADTLEAFLDHAGDVQAAAEQLYVHRTTLYYRLQRIEEYTGAHLANGEDRLALHLGLKIARLMGLRHHL